MAILRSEIRNKYSTIPNEVIRNKILSHSEYRLLIYLYSLPDNWKINQGYLANELGTTRNKINQRLSNIKKHGFLDVEKNTNIEKNDVDYLYILKVPPVTNLGVSNLGVSNLGVSKTGTHINNNIINNNIINNKINKKENIKRKKYFEDEEVNELFNDFLQTRKKLKAVNSERAIKILQNKLNNFTNKEKVEMLNNSIENSWKGIYELKEKPKEEFKRHYL